jgi:hypothetical protein
MTLKEIRTRIRSILQEPFPARWQDTDINAYINAGLRDIAILAERIRTKTIDVAIGVETVTFPTDMLTLKTIYWGDGSQRYELDKALNTYPSDDTTQDDPTTAYIYDQAIHLRPKPQAAGKVTIVYHMKPVDMTLDADTPELQGAEDALISYGVYRAYFEDGDPRSQLWEQDYSKEQLKWLAVERENNNSPAFQVKARW